MEHVVIGIDPGTSCGWSVLDTDRGQRCLGCGTWDLKPRRHEGGGMRYLRFRQNLKALVVGSWSVKAVFYEEVRRHMGVDAAHVYGGIVGALGQLCEELAIPYQGITVQAVKRQATGHGGGKLTGKELVLAAARRKFPGLEIPDDNAADAIWVAIAGLREIGL